jgi:hypothetical protein
MRRAGKIRAFAFAALLAGGMSPAFGQSRSESHTGTAAQPAPIVRVYGAHYHGHFWGPAYPYYGYGGWGPWWWGPGWYGPGWYGPQTLNVRQVNYGAIQFDVKPLSSKVFVDGKYLGKVGDLSGRHHEADLLQGSHDVQLVGPGGRKTERNVFVAAGKTFKFKYDFEG